MIDPKEKGNGKDTEAGTVRSKALAKRTDRVLAAKEHRDQILEGAVKDDRKKIYQAKPLLICGLPYRPHRDKKSKKPIPHFVTKARLNRDFYLVTTFSTNKDPENGGEIPYGKDRVLMMWLLNKAFVGQSRYIKLSSILEYMKEFDEDTSGSTSRQVAMERLFRLESLTIRLDLVPVAEKKFTNLTAGGKNAERKAMAFPLFSYIHLPGDNLDKSKENLPEGFGEEDFFVVISAEIWETFHQHAWVPLDLHLMKQFANRPKAWDIAGFISYRAHGARETKKGVFIPWNDLREQLGSVDTNSTQLKNTVREVLAEIQNQWPGGLNVALDANGNMTIQPPALNIVEKRPALSNKAEE